MEDVKWTLVGNTVEPMLRSQNVQKNMIAYYTISGYFHKVHEFEVYEYLSDLIRKVIYADGVSAVVLKDDMLFSLRNDEYKSLHLESGEFEGIAVGDLFYNIKHVYFIRGDNISYVSNMINKKLIDYFEKQIS